MDFTRVGISVSFITSDFTSKSREQWDARGPAAEPQLKFLTAFRCSALLNLVLYLLKRLLSQRPLSRMEYGYRRLALWSSWALFLVKPRGRFKMEWKSLPLFPYPGESVNEMMYICGNNALNVPTIAQHPTSAPTPVFCST